MGIELKKDGNSGCIYIQFDSMLLFLVVFSPLKIDIVSKRFELLEYDYVIIV